MKKPLTKGQVSKIQEPGFYRVADTLYLRVKNNGRKTWVQRLLINSRRTDWGLGSLDIVSMTEAKQKALENRVDIYHGRTRSVNQRKLGSPTFREAAVECNRFRWKNLRNPISRKEPMQRLEKYVFPVIGNKPCHQISKRDVTKILEPIWTTKPGTGEKVRRFIKQTLAHWLSSSDDFHVNVAGEGINGGLKSAPKSKESFRHLDYRKLNSAIKDIETVSLRYEITRVALLFVIHTAARVNEVLQAKWSEIDFQAGIWTRPADRMKNGQTHKIPLSTGAVSVLEKAVNLRNDSDLIFPSPVKPSRPMVSESLLKILRKAQLAEKTVVHGFRSTFSTWARERTEANGDLIEIALSHSVGSSIERSYNHAEMLEQRRDLMQKWSDFISG